MYCGNNKIALASQKQIMNAFLNLLEMQSFSNISISKICNEAGVSRQTFYKLYESKENVIIDLLTYYRYMPEKTYESDNYSKGLASLYPQYAKYLVTNKKLIQMLVTNGIISFLYNSLYSSLIECSFFLKNETDSEREYTANFIAGAFTGIANAYIKRGGVDDCDYLENEISLLLQRIIS